MKHDPIDQALRDEATISSSPDFPHRVMRAVLQEADLKAALPFPWKPLATGLAVAAGLTLAGVLLGGPAPAPSAFAPPGPLAHALAWLTAALTGSLGVVWWSVRFAGR